MNTRRAARELTLLAFSQLSKNVSKWQEKDLSEIVVASVRTLVNNAENELKNTVGSLIEIKNYIENYTVEHPTNLEKPIDAVIVPVPVPLTSDMIAKTESLVDVADVAFSALEIAEMSALSNIQSVKDYIFNTINLYNEHKNTINEQIKNLAKGWDLDRLVRIDKDILSIAITELLYIPEIPISVSIDEAVELAKKYSTDESSSFINGVLREVVEKNNLYDLKK